MYATLAQKTASRARLRTEDTGTFNEDRVDFTTLARPGHITPLSAKGPDHSIAVEEKDAMLKSYDILNDIKLVGHRKGDETERYLLISSTLISCCNIYIDDNVLKTAKKSCFTFSGSNCRNDLSINFREKLHENIRLVDMQNMLSVKSCDILSVDNHPIKVGENEFTFNFANRPKLHIVAQHHFLPATSKPKTPVKNFTNTTPSTILNGPSISSVTPVNKPPESPYRRPIKLSVPVKPVSHIISLSSNDSVISNSSGISVNDRRRMFEK